MAHPFHKGIKGQQGGSLPKVHNNLLKACGADLEKQRQNVQTKLGGLKNPVSRLVK